MIHPVLRAPLGTKRTTQLERNLQAPVIMEPERESTVSSCKGIVLVILGICLCAFTRAYEYHLLQYYPVVQLQLGKSIAMVVFSLSTQQIFTRLNGNLANRNDRELLLLQSSFMAAYSLFKLYAFSNLRFDECSAVIYTFPVWTTWMSFYFRGEGINVSNATLQILNILAVVLIVDPLKLWGEEQQQFLRTLLGLAMAVASVLCFSMQLFVMRFTGPSIQWCTCELYAGLVWAAILCPLAALGQYLFDYPDSFLWEHIWVDLKVIDTASITVMGMGTFISFGLINEGIKLAPVAPAAFCFLMGLPLTFVLQYLIFGQSPDVLGWVGMSTLMASDLLIGHTNKHPTLTAQHRSASSTQQTMSVHMDSIEVNT
eukprot:jgi/Bigna1/79702/fgenesh1_pg.64_\